MASKTAKSPSDPSRAVILVAEDDPTSGQFFRAALATCGWDARVEANGDAALALARQHRFDLLLLDCHLPGANAERIVAILRADRAAASHAVPAIATSAELRGAQRQALLAAGFAAVIDKPATLNTLKAVLGPLLPGYRRGPALLLDDTDAGANSGTPNAVGALRTLFAGELRRLASELDGLAAQPDAFAARLHRLLASCGFCGASALAQACRGLRPQLEHGPAPDAALARFRATLDATLQALTAPPAADAPEDQ